MLAAYKLYKNQRGRYISFELDVEENVYRTYLIGRKGIYSFVSSVKPENEDNVVKKLNLTLASEEEHAKIALFRSNENLKMNIDGDLIADLFNG